MKENKETFVRHQGVGDENRLMSCNVGLKCDSKIVG